MKVNDYFRPIGNTNCLNDEFRADWIRNSILEISSKSAKNLKLLDVGAGPSSLKPWISSLGISYFSSDFNNYKPDKNAIGQQSLDWKYAEHDFVCDLLEIPEDQKYDIVICTEVLEHVPDPVKALTKLEVLLNENGSLLISVPLHSQIHHAPFFYSAGLSPFWFIHHHNLGNTKIDKLEIYGDYEDFLRQEISRAIEHSYLGNFSFVNRRIRFIARNLARILCHKMSNDVRYSAGFGTLVQLSKL